MKSKSHFKNMTILFIVWVLLYTSLFVFVQSFVFAEADDIEENFPTSDGTVDFEKSCEGDFEFTDSDGYAEIKNYTGKFIQSQNEKEMIVNIPSLQTIDKMHYRAVTSIADSAFDASEENLKLYPMRNKIMGIVVPDSVKSIGQTAFAKMQNLKWVIINSDEIYMENNFLGNSECEYPPNLRRIYLPHISKSNGTDLFSGKNLSDEIEIFYSEDCYSLDLGSIGEQDVYDPENLSIKLKDNSDQFVFTVKNDGLFDNQISIFTSGTNGIDDSVFEFCDCEEISSDNGLTFNLKREQEKKIKIKVKENLNASEYSSILCVNDLGRKRELRLNLSIDASDKNGSSSESEFIGSTLSLPMAKQDLVYNGDDIDLLDIECLDNLPEDLKVQFAFELDGEWLDLSKDCLPQKKNAGTYKIYLRAIDNNGDTKKIFEDEEKNYIEVKIEPKSLKVSGEIIAQNKVYDGTNSINLDVSNLSLEGIIGDDDVYLDQETLENLIGETNDKNAGIRKKVCVLNLDKLSLTNNELGNYILEEPEFNDLTVNIYKRKVKIDGSIRIQDKEYDGNNLMSFDASEINLVGIVDGDGVVLDPESLKNIKCEVSDKNVGIGKTVSISNTDKIVLANNELENYVLDEIDWNKIFGNQTVEIKPKKLKISGNIIARNRVYNANNCIELNTDNLNLDGIVDGDDVILDPVSLKNLKGETKNKNAGKNKKVIILNLDKLSLANNELGNYVLEKPEINDLTVDIYKIKIKIKGKLEIPDKEYDGKAKVDMTGCDCSAENLASEPDDLPADVCNDDLAIETKNLVGVLEDEDYSVGNNKKVRIYGNLFLTGKDKINYELEQDFDRESTVNVKPREIKIVCDGEIKPISREYNGLLDVDLDLENLLNTLKIIHASDSKIGIVKGDEVKIDFADLKGEMDDKKVGQNKKINIIGSPVLTGTDKDNYKLIFSPEDILLSEETTVNIEPRVLNLNGKLAAIDKIYDKTNLIELEKDKLFLDGKIENDDVSLNLEAIHGFSDDGNVGDKKRVEIICDQDILQGADQENYVLNYNSVFDDIFVNILARELNINGDFEIEDRFYDGTDIVDLKHENIKLDANNICVGDCVELKLLDLSANTEDKNAGENKNIEIKGAFVLEGEQAKNYVLNEADIKKIFGDKKINIKKLPAEFVWNEKKEFEYDGSQHEIKASVKNKKFADDIFNLKYDNNTAVEAGNYVAKVISLGNENYSLENTKNIEQKWSIKELVASSYSGGGGGEFSSSSSSGQSNNYIYDMNKLPDKNQINDANNMINYSQKRNLGDILIPERIKQKKYLSGYNDTTFKLDDKVTRAEFLQAVYNLINNNESINSSVLNKFTDVDKNAWYAKALAYLSERKIVNGYGNKSRINDFITRGEMAKILFDVLVLLDNNSSKSYAYGNCDYKFVDLPENYWATEVIKQLASNGMINGYEDRTFRAQKSVTLAEAVATIEKIFARDRNYTASEKAREQKQYL